MPDIPNRPNDPLSALRRLAEHRNRGIRHAAGSPIYDSAVAQLREQGVSLTPYQALDAGLV